MDQLDGAGFFGHGGNPVEETLLVGMGGIAGEKGMHRCLYRKFPAMNGDLAGVLAAPLRNLSAQGAVGLIADKKDIRLGGIESGNKMIDYAATGAHAAAGNDNRWSWHFDKLLVVTEVRARKEVLEVDGIVSLAQKVMSLFVPILLLVGID